MNTVAYIHVDGADIASHLRHHIHFLEGNEVAGEGDAAGEVGPRYTNGRNGRLPGRRRRSPAVRVCAQALPSSPSAAAKSAHCVAVYRHCSSPVA